MILGLIPARLNSTRLKKKPLIRFNNIPLVVHVYNLAVKSKKLDQVIICADDMEIVNIAKKYNCKVVLTSKQFRNGTERIAHVARKMKCKLVVDIQCDNFFLDPKEIDKLINFHLKNKKFDIVVPHADFKKRKDKSAVKIIFNQQNKILMMSRSDVPCYYGKDSKPMSRHQDFISFKKKALLDYTKLKPTLIEKIEKIELLRAIENEMIIGTLKVKVLNDVNSLNTKQDLRFIKKFIYEQKKII